MPEIFGTDFLEAARDVLVAKMNALKTTMDDAGDYDPAINLVVPRHNEVMTALPAISIDLASGESAPDSTGGVVGVMYRMAFTIRVHTARVGGVTDGVEISKLLNSVINKLHTNINLDDTVTDANYVEVDGSHEGAQVFDESYTIGGEIAVVVQRTISQTREV